MINVVCASDIGFIAHMATMLRSLVENNSREEICIFILLDNQLNDDDKNKIIAMLDSYPVSIAFIPIEENLLPQNLPVVRGHISRAAYARLLIDQLLPAGIGRVLYLDCDMIVRGDIKELWERDLAGKTVGAVREAVPYSNHATLGLPLGAPYFNTGVMLIDLERWRALEIGHRSLDFVCNNPDKILWWDQCALNLVLYEDWMSLDNKWNVQTMTVGKGIYNSIHFKRMNANARKAVSIAHFSGTSKPWHYLNDHPMKEEYLEYRRHTPWPLIHFEDENLKNWIRRVLNRHFPLVTRLYHAYVT